jgi:hypothetical protein
LVLIAGCSGGPAPSVPTLPFGEAAEAVKHKKLIGDYLKGKFWDNLKGFELCESVRCRLGGSNVTLIRVKYHLHRGVSIMESIDGHGTSGPPDRDRVFEVTNGVFALECGDAAEGWQERELAKRERAALQFRMEFSR